MARAFAEIAFTQSVLEAQEANGSAGAYAPFLEADAERADRIGPAERAFIEARDGFYQATVSSGGWPYVQFRGGPRGFLRVLDETTVAYADYRGNRQYVSLGNLTDDGRVALILMDYPRQARLKLWGRVRFVDVKDDPALVARTHVGGGEGKPERAAIIAVEALDWNCPAHIPQRLTVEELQPYLRQTQARLKALEAENKELRRWVGKPSDQPDKTD